MMNRRPVTGAQRPSLLVGILFVTQMLVGCGDVTIAPLPQATLAEVTPPEASPSTFASSTAPQGAETPQAPTLAPPEPSTPTPTPSPTPTPTPTPTATPTPTPTPTATATATPDAATPPPPSVPPPLNTRMAAGNDFSLALRSNGRVFAWGVNGLGQLGDGGTTSHLAPLGVVGLDKVVDLTAGDAFAAVVTAGGEVFAWGSNSEGQLGLAPDDHPHPVPEKVTGVSDIVDVEAGLYNLYLLDSQGVVYASGANQTGALGGGHTEAQVGFEPVAGLPPVVELAAGDGFALARTQEGQVWGWGSNRSGQLGDTNPEPRPTPAPIALTEPVAQIATGWAHSLALTPAGHLYSWGHNGAGQLGRYTEDPYYGRTPEYVEGLSEVHSIAAGYHFSLAAVGDGRHVEAWGRGVDGQLGNGGSNSQTPTPARDLHDILLLTGGYHHTLALQSDGTVHAFGDNTRGALAQPELKTYGYSEIVDGIIDVATGYGHTLALSFRGEVFAWGSNASCELGTGGVTAPHDTPTLVEGLSSIVDIAAGDGFSLAVRNGGDLLGWGANTRGQLATADTSTLCIPTGLAPELRWREVQAGQAFAVALSEDGRLYAWGDGRSGQLGSGEVTDQRWQPRPVQGPAGVRGYAVGAQHALAIDQYGYTWTWGENSAGQLGTGSSLDSADPAIPITLHGARLVAAGDAHSLVLKHSGEALGFGSDSRGQLGLGGQSRVPSPTAIDTLNNVGSIAWLTAGRHQTWAVTEQGRRLALGQGDGGADGIAVQTRISHGPERWGERGLLRCFAALDYGFGLSHNGGLYAFGGNATGQLGLGDKSRRLTPQRSELTPHAVPLPLDVVSVVPNGSRTMMIDAMTRVWEWDAEQTREPRQLPGMEGAAVLSHEARYVVFRDGQVRYTDGSDPQLPFSDVVSVADTGHREGLILRGNGHVHRLDSPYGRILGLEQITAIAASGGHNLAVDSSGTVWGWGSNQYAQLSSSVSDAYIEAPIPLTHLPPATAIAAGARHSAALVGGDLWLWGAAGPGQPSYSWDPQNPHTVVPLGNAYSLMASGYATLTLRLDGTLHRTQVSSDIHCPGGADTSPYFAYGIHPGGEHVIYAGDGGAISCDIEGDYRQAPIPGTAFRY